MVLLALDLRRRRFLNIFFLMRFPVVMMEPDVSESELSDELVSSEEEDEFMMS